jgi:hypothetical protein
VKWHSKSETGSERKSSAHPDAKRNEAYLKDYLKRPEIQNLISSRGITVTWSGLNQNYRGEFSELIFCSFYWRKDGIPHGFPISLHQSHTDMVLELDRMLPIPAQKPQKMKDVAALRVREPEDEWVV